MWKTSAGGSQTVASVLCVVQQGVRLKERWTAGSWREIWKRRELEYDKKK
jgi:hypothetical protein